MGNGADKALRPKAKPKFYILEDLIRRGKTTTARNEVQRIARGKVPRAEVAELAAFARRVALPDLALKLLYPIVRPASRTIAQPTPKEQAEYAAALVRAGGLEEAIELLKRLEREDLPETLLYGAFARIGQWNYSEAIPLLEKYLAKVADDYSRDVAETNLAAALVHERQWEKAIPLLERLEKHFSEKALPLLYGNVMKQKAEAFFLQKDWPAAEKAIEKARLALPDPNSRDAFFVRKWEIFMALFRQGASAKNLKRLQGYREEARKKEHWETLRDCDRAQAVVTSNEALFLKLYVGTPYDGFRFWLEKDFGRSAKLPEYFDWNFGEESTSKKRLSLEGLDYSQAEVRLLRILCGDFYRPFLSATLHTRLFPDEFYSPQSSPGRIRTQASRLRDWLRKGKFPLVVGSHDNSYQLSARGKLTVRIPTTTRAHSREENELDRLKRQWPTEEFRVGDAAEFLGLSSRSCQRLLDPALQAGKLVRLGAGRNTRYRFA